MIPISARSEKALKTMRKSMLILLMEVEKVFLYMILEA